MNTQNKQQKMKQRSPDHQTDVKTRNGCDETEINEQQMLMEVNIRKEIMRQMRTHEKMR